MSEEVIPNMLLEDVEYKIDETRLGSAKLRTY